MKSGQPDEPYRHLLIEKKWQKVWQEKQIDHARIPDLTDKDPACLPARQGSTAKPKYYALVEFPYPSGAGLHVGHVRAWSAIDAYARKKRMEGYNVLFPMGWDAFGLPAENYAIKKGVHPSITTAENIANFKRQIQSLGLSFDWSREINTTDPKYYKWTQWIFLKLLEHGLAYQKEVPVNWCSSCRTNLADEEVLPDGTHERCGQPTEKRLQKQWLLRITKYADRLIEDLKSVDFPSKVSVQQVNWIGRSEGVHVDFQIAGTDKKVIVFTTAHDTIFGATFMVLSPEHPLVGELLSSAPTVIPASEPESTSGSRIKSGMTRVDESRLDEIRKYVERAKSKLEQDRIAEGKVKTGVNTGLKVVNPFTNKEIPVFVADYVLMRYGTGAVMGVPGHDTRDHEFAEEYDLPVKPVIRPVDEARGRSKVKSDGFWEYGVIKSEFAKESVLFDSGSFSDLSSSDAKIGIEKELIGRGIGEKVVNYHLHDWIFSRQHYWGEPIPVVYCAGCARSSSKRSHLQKARPSKEYAIVPVPEAQLPVELPYVEKYEPSGTGESPLANIESWVNTPCPKCGGPAQRETDTMPNWAGSNWYYLAYLFADKLGEQNGLSRRHSGLDPESKSLDAGSTPGMTKGLGHSDFLDVFTANKSLISYWMPVDVYEGGYEHTTLHLLYSRFIYKFLYDLGAVPGPEPYARRRSHGIVLGPDGRKMSKSFGNVVNPEEIVAEYGADSLRLYEMFIGPFDQAVSWNADSLAGCRRFLAKVFRLFQDGAGGESSPELKKHLHKTIKKVSKDLEALKFNTAVSALMEFVNVWEDGRLSKADAGVFLRLLAPFAPHLAEELWSRLRDQPIPADRKDTDSRRLSAKISASPNQRKSATSWSVHQQSWPTYDERLLKEEKTTVVVQINGKLRERLRVNVGAGEIEVRALAEKSPRLSFYFKGKIEKVVFVQDKLINFVIEL